MRKLIGIAPQESWILLACESNACCVRQRLRALINSRKKSIKNSRHFGALPLFQTLSQRALERSMDAKKKRFSAVSVPSKRAQPDFFRFCKESIDCVCSSEA